MKEKITSFLTSDIRFINKYLLIAIILIILTCAGGTSYALFSYEVYAPGTIHIKYNPPATCDEIGIDLSNATSPKDNLPSNMIAVCYDSKNDVWRKADVENTKKGYKWYSYSDKVWANAVTVSDINTTTSITLNTKEEQSCDGNCNREDYLNAPVGSVIPISDINTMFVWIPRFSALMTENQAGEYNASAYCTDSTYTSFDACSQAGETWYTKGYLNPGAFDITFVDKNTTAHDAFTFGEEVEGLWVGKFENSTDTECSPTDHSAVESGCNLTTIRPKIIPNQESWRGASVSTFFYDILSMTETGNLYGFSTGEVDTHMIKNNEWGAVAYLTQSIYGRCSSSTSCSKMGMNNRNPSITGYGAPAESIVGAPNGAYNTSLGMNASTTGNVYGIYDMSGGSWEYVMGLYKTSTLSGISDYSGFSNTTSNSQYESLPNSKYYNTYTTEASYTSDLQHALLDTNRWFGNRIGFVVKSNPWIIRGDHAIYGDKAGIYSYYNSTGDALNSGASRTVLIM